VIPVILRLYNYIIMKTYELLYMISSQISQEESDNVKKDFEAFVQSHNGVIVASEKKMPQPLAYPINGISSGYIVTATLQLPENTVKEISQKLEKNTHVLRHMITIKPVHREVKERRTRKPITEPATPSESPFKKPEEQDKKHEGKVQMDEMEKKLDEILSE